MFLSDKKRITTMIKSRLSGDGTSSQFEAKNEEDMGEVKDDAHIAMAEEFISAIEKKSVLDFAKALENLCEYIAAKDYEQDEQDEE